jgi:hypothetical protein
MFVTYMNHIPQCQQLIKYQIRRCATAFYQEDGETIILVLRQALWFGDELEKYLACLGRGHSFSHFLTLYD